MNVCFYPFNVSQFTHRTLFVLILSCNEKKTQKNSILIV